MSKAKGFVALIFYLNSLPHHFDKTFSTYPSFVRRLGLECRVGYYTTLPGADRIKVLAQGPNRCNLEELGLEPPTFQSEPPAHVFSNKSHQKCKLVSRYYLELVREL